MDSKTNQENAYIRYLLEGTAAKTGDAFFKALVSNLAKLLGAAGSWVTEYFPEQQRLRSKAFWFENKYIEGYEYHINGTPCEPVIKTKKLYRVPDKVTIRFPNDPDLSPLNAVSYMGAPLFDENRQIIGHLAVLDTKPMLKDQEHEQLFQIFAARAAAELNRMKAQQLLFEQKEQLDRLLDSAMDAIIEFDESFKITRINRAVEKTFQIKPAATIGNTIEHLLDTNSGKKLRLLIAELTSNNESPNLWIPGGLKGKTGTSDIFPVEASLSRFMHRGTNFYSLILRNLRDKIKAEQKIHSLENQTEYLREELNSHHNYKSIIGTSSALRKTLQAASQVAQTDSTVLILGETGVGKELIARAVHEESKRNKQPLVKVNCAAISPALMESEFFGHEKGAFTGATQHRDGRFILADNGTIFLDEIGELPLDLQAKLLRVLQEGEYEPVGSSKTCKVDVRVIAATNRDLPKMIKEKLFREDLYYRLHVFPIEIPPLRERGKDIILLAETFAQSFAKKIGKPLLPLSASCRDMLNAYTWPGNIRELQNVVERAVIRSLDGRLSFTELLGDTESNLSPITTSPHPHTPEEILTDKQLRALEKKNIIKALKLSGGKLAGKNGAAAMLGLPPSTLSSRIKALRITIPK